MIMKDNHKRLEKKAFSYKLMRTISLYENIIGDKLNVFFFIHQKIRA